MGDWKLLQFIQKYTLDMVNIPVNRKDIKKNTQVRLFLYKPKSPTEIVHEVTYKIDYHGIQIYLSLNIKCREKKDNMRNGMIETILDNHPIKLSYNKKDSYISINEFIEHETNEIKICDGEMTNYFEISKITKNSPKSIQLNDDKVKMDLQLDLENKLVNGIIQFNISLNNNNYLNLLNQPVYQYNYLPSKNYHTIRAMYNIIKKQGNNYMGKLCKEFLSKDSKELVPPDEIDFCYKDIFQMNTFALDKTTGWSYDETKDVTDWNGRCLDPIVRTMLKTNDKVRCRMKNMEGGCCNPYFIIIDIINNDEFYGEVQNPYTQGEKDWLPNKLITFTINKLSFNSISEIPLNWQTDEKKEKLKPYLLDIGYSMTGSTVI